MRHFRVKTPHFFWGGGTTSPQIPHRETPYRSSRLGAASTPLASRQNTLKKNTSYLKPNTHCRRRRDATQLSSWVASASAVWTEFATSSRRLPTDSVDNLENEHNNNGLTIREFWSILITFSTITSMCRHLSPTAQEIVYWVTTADGCVHSADATQLDSVEWVVESHRRRQCVLGIRDWSQLQ